MRLECLHPYSTRAETIWRALEDRSSPTYFFTWSWIENWLACVPRDSVPSLAVLVADEPVAACFLGRRALWRHGFVRSRALYLNATGHEDIDDICIEHNTVVGGASLADIVLALDDDWDELFLPALSEEAFARLANGRLPPGIELRVERELPSRYVDLDKVRARGYLPLVGASSRAQIRKAERDTPDLVYEVAQDVEQAFELYAELAALHQRYWTARGQPGSFANPFFDRFHRRLIAARYDEGELQLGRLRAGTRTIGVVYLLVANGQVLFYQSGLAHDAFKHLKPGFLIQRFSVEHCARAGHRTYDFLGGDAQYKKSLTTDETKLVWARLQRRRPSFAIEDGLRMLRHSLRRLSQARTPA